MNIAPIEEREETHDLPGLGAIKVVWLIRTVLRGGYADTPEQSENLVMHFFGIDDPKFEEVMLDAYDLGRLGDVGRSLERSYTEEFHAYDAIIYGIDPCYAEIYKNMFIDGLKLALQKHIDQKPEKKDYGDGFQVLDE